MNTTRVWYHAECLDGWASAFEIWRCHVRDKSGDFNFHPIKYGDSIPDYDLSDTIWCVDFAFNADVTREDLEEIYDAVDGRFTIIDHHKSARAKLDGFPGAVFDLEKSGCVLTWEYLFPDYGEPPRLLRYIQDADLWRFAMPESRAIKAGLESIPRTDFAEWFTLARDLDDVAIDGCAILRNTDMEVHRIAAKASPVAIAGHDALVVNGSRCFGSRLGQTLASRSPSGVGIAWSLDGQVVRWELRSIDTGPDVSEIAELFGGGGHEHAAGFETTPVEAMDMLRHATLPSIDALRLVHEDVKGWITLGGQEMLIDIDQAILKLDQEQGPPLGPLTERSSAFQEVRALLDGRRDPDVVAHHCSAEDIDEHGGDTA